jgi:hypothetical protein
LPSDIRLEGYIVPDAFRSCAESRFNEALTGQNATLSAVDTAKTRIGLVLYLILVMQDLHRIPNHSTCDDCASHQPAGQQNGSGAKKVPPDAEGDLNFLGRWYRQTRPFATRQGVMAVSYTAKGDSFTAGKPRLWTETRLRNIGAWSNYDLAPDGKRLAAILADSNKDKPPTHLTFLLNLSPMPRSRFSACVIWST